MSLLLPISLAFLDGECQLSLYRSMSTPSITTRRYSDKPSRNILDGAATRTLPIYHWDRIHTADSLRQQILPARSSPYLYVARHGALALLFHMQGELTRPMLRGTSRRGPEACKRSKERYRSVRRRTRVVCACNQINIVSGIVARVSHGVVSRQ